MTLQPQEGLLLATRAFQQRSVFRPCVQSRNALEHRIARLVQLGLCQARYMGRAKTIFQLQNPVVPANLTLLAYSSD